LRNIRKHLSALQELKQIKEYGNAVLFIEQNYTRKRESIRKVVLLTDAFLQDRSLKKEDVSETAKENVEPAALKPAGKKSTRGQKEKTKKEPKLSTFDVTFNLFREKMSVSEIAVHRGLSESTIENHLSKKIASGDLDVLELLPEDKVHTIRKAAKELSTTNLTPILEVLGSEYTYGDIRLALAGWMPA
jgi:DNA-binding transcriptional ArsR family regulator